MNLHLICLVFSLSFASSLHSQRVSPHDEQNIQQIHKSGYRVRRQDSSTDPDNTTNSNTTGAEVPTTISTTNSTKKMPTGGKRNERLIKILVGTLVALGGVTLFLGVMVALIVVCCCQMNRRRREDRDLVLRTKLDIFEEIPNLVVDSSRAPTSPLHNTIDTAHSENDDSVGIDISMSGKMERSNIYLPAKLDE